ncbi:MAG TPA: MraY family glycosyltransferase [Cytophagaceae bacterium]|nr:MraY family glycosyltransferase [Cytophagaceae bacterium]
MEYYHLALSFIWSFLIAVFAIPSIIHVAHVKNLLDEPNLRTMHESLTPRLGGLAIFAGFMSSLTIFGDLNNSVQQLLAGCIVIFFIGLKDDIVSVSAFKKFFVQILATGIIMFMGKITISNFQGTLGIFALEEETSFLFTFIVIIGITNAINLIDGVDGLAGVIILIAASAFGVYFYRHGGAFTSYAYVSFALAGAIIGFLRYNLHKAIIFMGDTGSLVCGFIVSILAIQFIEMNATAGGETNSPAIAIAILIIPIMDTIRVFILRILAGVSPFSPDKNHIHHRLITLGLSHLNTVLILAAINIAAIALAVSLSFLNTTTLVIIILTYAFLFSIIVEILVRNRKGKAKETNV